MNRIISKFLVYNISMIYVNRLAQEMLCIGVRGFIPTLPSIYAPAARKLSR